VDHIFSQALHELDGLLFEVFIVDSVMRSGQGEPEGESLKLASVQEVRERRAKLPVVEKAVVASLRKALPLAETRD